MPSPKHTTQIKVIYGVSNQAQHWGLFLNNGDVDGFGTLFDNGGKSSGWALVDFFFMMPSLTSIFHRRENWSKSGIEAGGGKVVTFANYRATERRMGLTCAEVLKC